MERGESARRRKELLDRTRSLYGDREVPAIHPRYRAAYHKIYEEDRAEKSTETFGVRTVLCILLFMAFVLMDNQDIDIAQSVQIRSFRRWREETQVQDVDGSGGKCPDIVFFFVF